MRFRKLLRIIGVFQEHQMSGICQAYSENYDYYSYNDVNMSRNVLQSGKYFRQLHLRGEGIPSLTTCVMFDLD
jgi:hypothetical protein